MARSKMKGSENSVEPATSTAVDRRAFIKSSSIALASVAISGCAEGGTGPGDETGTVEVEISGLGAAGAGTVTVAAVGPGASSGVQIPLPAAVGGVSLGVASGVPVGQYSITYNHPANHQHVTPASGTQQFTVAANATVRVDFVVQATGTLEVLVTGLAAGATSAGSVAISRVVGVPPGTVVTLPAPAAGQSLGANVAHPVGSFRVTYTAPVGHAGTEPSNFKDVVVPFGATVRATFLVEETGAPSGLVFASDWKNASLDHDGVTDGGKWVPFGGNLSAWVIASAAGLDFPTANVFRCEYNGSSYAVGRMIVANELEVGQEIFRRVYWRYALTSGVLAGHSNHPLESTANPVTGNTVRPHALEMTNSTAGGPMDVRWLQSYDNQPTFPERIHRWRVSLQPDTTYRLEWAMKRLGTEEWKTRARVYTSNNALLYDDQDFICTNAGHENHSLASSGTAYNTNVTAGVRALSISGTSIGYQGGYNFVGEFMYWGAFAASLSDWCGPYIPGEAD